MQNLKVLEKNFGGPNSMLWRGLYVESIFGGEKEKYSSDIEYVQ